MNKSLFNLNIIPQQAWQLYRRRLQELAEFAPQAMPEGARARAAVPVEAGLCERRPVLYPGAYDEPGIMNE